MPVYVTCGLVEVDIDALQLQIGVSVVRAGRVDPMLVRDHLPELDRNVKHDYVLQRLTVSLLHAVFPTLVKTFESWCSH